MSAYSVVAEFEAALCAYTGARYAVTTNSCSMAIFLALKAYTLAWGRPFQIRVPRRTYASVPMAVLHAGAGVGCGARALMGAWMPRSACRSKWPGIAT